MHNTLVVFKKQLCDTLKNKIILAQFILLPVMTLIFENAITIDGMAENYFAKLFSGMYIGMAPLMATASIISEEKEKNTLRVLMMGNIKPWQYLIGIGSYVWTICMMGALLMSINFPAKDRPFYLVMMALGMIISILTGACIGVFSKNQMKATSIVMPVMMILAFIPMIAMFNDTVKKFSKVLYTAQLQNLFNEMSFSALKGSAAIVLGVNALICVLLFVLAYKRKGLE